MIADKGAFANRLVNVGGEKHSNYGIKGSATGIFLVAHGFFLTKS